MKGRSATANQLPSNLVEGASGAILSAAIYGNWNDLLIGEWGVVDLLINPYSKDKSGDVRATIFMDVDIAARREESFSVAKDINTG